MISRRQAMLVVAAGATAASAQEGKPMLNELMAISQKDKKGLTFYVKGQTIGGLVLRYDNDFVEVRNQTHSRIVIRIASIDGAALI